MNDYLSLWEWRWAHHPCISSTPQNPEGMVTQADLVKAIKGTPIRSSKGGRCRAYAASEDQEVICVGDAIYIIVSDEEVLMYRQRESRMKSKTTTQYQIRLGKTLQARHDQG